MTRLAEIVAHAGSSVSLAATIALAAGITPSAGHAQTNTLAILNYSVAALPSCLKYELRGVCFFWRCSLFNGCGVYSSFKVRHYVPDVVISTYNDTRQHPWADVGQPLATVLSGAGSVLLNSGLDASANTDRTGQEEVTFKSVDVIGNPIGQIAQMLSGASPGLPRNFAFPGFTELSNFPSSELPRIAQQWRQVPQDAGGELVKTVRQTVEAPAALLADVRRVFQAAAVIKKTVGVADIGQKVQKFTALDRGPLRAIGLTIDAVGAGSFLCPGSATVFGLHMQSDLDGPFWRGLVPLEMLYPGSWIPGLQEVSRGSGLISTWGSVYPRTGALAQVHPVKASAVLASRAASIVTQSAQPHIYTRLRPGGDMHYFETFGAPKWQALYPVPSTGCITFGENDSLSLASFGDAKTSGSAGYVWNLWHRYECCQNRGSYMFSVP